MKNFILLLFLTFFTPLLASSQKWILYSDSVLFHFKNNETFDAVRFIDSAEAEINKIIVIKDTNYADYLYRKGVVKSSLGDFNSDLLKESLNIWESIRPKNFLKIMKINYFIGTNYYTLGSKTKSNSNFEESYTYLKKCYLLIKKYKFQNQSNLKGLLNCLMILDYYFNKDYNNAKKYSIEYIDLIMSTGLENFDFDYSNALKYKNDIISQENVLLEYLKKYQIQKLKDPNLLFKIYYELFSNKSLFFIEGTNLKKYPLEIINFAEKALEVYNNEEIPIGEELNVLYSGLFEAYDLVGDNVKRDKYDSLYNLLIGDSAYNKIFNDTEYDRYYNDLEKMYYNNDSLSFGKKFNEIEKILKKGKKFNELLEITKFSLILFERSILFKKEDIDNQLDFINNNKSLLSNENKNLLDLLIVEFYAVTGQLNKALKICDQNLNIDNVEFKLKFYKFKSACEFTLGNIENANKTIYKAIEIATNIYGDNDPRLLPLFVGVLDMDLIGTNPNTKKLAIKALKILYKNKLEMTTIAVNVWQSLGVASSQIYNYKDALIYFENSKKIIENSKMWNKPFLYLSCLINLADLYIAQNKLQLANEYLEKGKVILNQNPNISNLTCEGYYYTLGNYYFQQDEFLKAKINYEKSFSFYNSNFGIKKLRYILCDYFIDNNPTKTIKRIEEIQKESIDPFWGLSILYLIKYNSGNIFEAKNILIKQLNQLIQENKEYFHLLSNDEKELLFKRFSMQFEYLNTYLLESDSGFLSHYINFRFYSKSLLVSNYFNSGNQYVKNVEILAELKKNNFLINKAIEKKSIEINNIEELKSKNRELEKFLSSEKLSLITPTLNDLNNSLNQNEAYVEIIRINKQTTNNPDIGKDVIKIFTDSIFYGAIVVKKNENPKFILIDTINQLENKFISDFNNKIQKKKEDKSSYQLLFEKIDFELVNINKVFFVSDGVYNSINIESIYNPNKNKYLIDYLKIQQIQNINSITNKKNEFKISSFSNAVLFGNPNFNLSIQDSSTTEYFLERSLDSNILGQIKSGINISSLPGTEKEIQIINHLFNESKSIVTLFSSSNATESNLKKVKSPDILHIATHGYFIKKNETSKTKLSIINLFNDNYQNDSYLKSGLLLAGAQKTINGYQVLDLNNGIFSSLEAKNLNLQGTELVVLSACETGLGDNLVGDGVVGLQRAFMIAGAKSIVMSLWSVNDDKTQKLMTLFYENLVSKNMSTEDALYNAKKELKKTFPQPYYWAGFVLIE
jgi:CHAT domain-containing protein